MATPGLCCTCKGHPPTWKPNPKLRAPGGGFGRMMPCACGCHKAAKAPTALTPSPLGNLSDPDQLEARFAAAPQVRGVVCDPNGDQSGEEDP